MNVGSSKSYTTGGSIFRSKYVRVDRIKTSLPYILSALDLPDSQTSIEIPLH